MYFDFLNSALHCTEIYGYRYATNVFVADYDCDQLFLTEKLHLNFLNIGLHTLSII